MNKVIDFEKNVATLCDDYPKLKSIMVELGFKDIVKPLALNTMGRIMTIPKGAAIKEISMEEIIKTLKKNGFSLVNIPEEYTELNPLELEEDQMIENELSENEKLLQSYIKRLTEGESLEGIKTEFQEHFSNVSALEIAKAEQTLMKEGTSLSDVQRLCDVHSSLFHGATEAERIEEAEKEVERNLNEEKLHQAVAGFDSTIAETTAAYMKEIGHPLQVLTLENKEIAHLVNKIEDVIKTDGEDENLLTLLKKLLTIAQHYGKKDELMFPLLKDVYGFSGPSDVMWGVEDEIRDKVHAAVDLLSEEKILNKEELKSTLVRIREMIYKEENILFPLCVSCFKKNDWIAIAKDMPMFGACFIEEIPQWDAVKSLMPDKKTMKNESNGKIVLPGGTFTTEQLRIMLNTLPMEITLIDENDINSFFNEGDKLFTRPTMAIGRKVYSCHPKRVEPMVRMLIHEFKTGKKDSMHIMSEKCGKKVLINYYAMRSESGAYIGTLEAVQELDGIITAINDGKKGPISL